MFAIFLTVRSLPWPKSLDFEGTAQNRYLPVGYQIWMLYSEWAAIHPRNTKSRFTDLGTASYNTTFHQRVSIVSVEESDLTRVTETSPSCTSVVR